MIPFTVAQFLGVFAEYNRAIWPAQIAAYALGAAAVAAAFRRIPQGGRIAAGALAALWLVNGLVYHAGFFAAINPAAYGFAVLFVLQALLVAWHGLWHDRLRPAWTGGWIEIAGLVLIAYAALLYPLLGLIVGHVWPAAPVFGVAPCPTVIFTFGLFLLVRPRAPASLLVIPILWAAIGGWAAVALGMAEDYALPVAALVAAATLWRSRGPLSSARRRR